MVYYATVGHYDRLSMHMLFSLLPTAGLLGAEKRSSSVELLNKSELGLALGGGAAGFVILGLEENNSSSSFSLLVAVGLSVK